MHQCINAFFTEPNSWKVSMNVILGSTGLLGARESMINLPNAFYSFRGKGLFKLIDQPSNRGYFYL